jgi:transcriptional regulator with XRE-family HTH domain
MVHYSSVHKLLKHLPTGEVANSVGVTPAYVSQVKHGRCQPSQKSIDAILQSKYRSKPEHDYVEMSLESRRASGCATNAIQYCESQMERFAADVPNYAVTTWRQIEGHFTSIDPNEYGLGNRRTRYLALRVFYRWLAATYGMNAPMVHMKGPHMGKPIMPTLTKEQTWQLLVTCPREWHHCHHSIGSHGNCHSEDVGKLQSFPSTASCGSSQFPGKEESLPWVVGSSFSSSQTGGCPA